MQGIERYEVGDTVQFTFVSSVAPAAAPSLGLYYTNSMTLVGSFTSTASDTTHYYGLFTMPTSLGYYLGEWIAQATFAGSLRTFTKRFAFLVAQTTIPPP